MDSETNVGCMVYLENAKPCCVALDYATNRRRHGITWPTGCY